MGLSRKLTILQICSYLLLILVLAGCSPPLNYSTNNSKDNPSPITQSDENNSKDRLSNNSKEPENDGALNNENFVKNLTPFFVYAADKTYVIDYVNNKISTTHRLLNVDKRFLSLNIPTSIFNSKDLSKLGDLPIEDCGLIQNVFIMDNYAISNCQYDCPPDQSKIQVWDIRSNSMIGELHIGWDEYCSYYNSLVYAPDNGRFLLSGPSSYARMFRINPLEEIEISNDENLVGQLTSSPDKKYVVADNRALWKWNDDGIEFIQAVSPPRTANMLSISSNAEYLVYEYRGGQNSDFVIVEKRETKSEIFRINKDDLMYGGFYPNYSAISHDGKYLFVSGYTLVNNIEEYYVIQIDISSGDFVHNFGPNYSNSFPSKLRIEYLPESIINNWVWESY